ncbi:MAG: sulfotransferase [Lysobacterales bacterium]|jgi:hypothetical protein
MPLPNFLHVGAAKTGTTSQYFYLRQHPEIYMSHKKGPEYFASLFPQGFGTGPGDGKKPVVTDRAEYESLFDAAGSARIIGEASVSYLYHHEHAIPLIRRYLGDPKILITLRNPAELAFAYYQHLKRQGREWLTFEEGLQAEGERIARGWHYHWHYQAVGHFADQVGAYLDSFSQVKVSLMEDLAMDAAGYMRALFRFLEVDDTFEPDLSTQFNRGGIPRSRILYRLIGGSRTRPRGVQLVGRLVGEERLMRLRERTRDRILRRDSIAPETRVRLLNAYRPDISRLEEMLGRDLSCWMEQP